MVNRKRKLPDREPDSNPKRPKPSKKSPKKPPPPVEETTSQVPALVAEGGTGVFQRDKVRIVSWNVNGFKAWIQKEGVEEVFNRPDIDVFCMNETKLQEPAVPAAKAKFPAYPYQYWTCSTVKKGYSGVALLSKTQPIAVSYSLGAEKHDLEGRMVTAEFSDLYIVATYVPNAGQKLERLSYRTEEWDEDLKQHLKRLDSTGKAVVWLGDLNVIHQDIDIYSMKGKSRCAGCTEEEKSCFSSLLSSGFRDSFREKYPEKQQFSWFSAKNKEARKENQGWRLDYAVVSSRLMDKVEEVVMYDQVTGSDHVPIEVVLRTT